MRSYNIVKVETYGERALALVIGHEDIHKEDHQYVEVNENLATMYYSDIYVSENSVSLSRNPSFTNIKKSLKSRFLFKQILKKENLFNNNSNDKLVYN